MKELRSHQIFVAVAALMLPAAQAAAQTATPADSVYSAMLSRLRSGDTTIDFQAFRVTYARTSVYDPMSATRAALRQRLTAALSSGDVKTAALRADSLLAGNYTDINAHVIRSSLAQQAHDAPKASHHAAVARGLVRSLDIEHRGASSANALLLIDPDEENVYGLVTGLERTQKYTTAECGQRVCDSTVFRNPGSGRDTTIVFDITLIAQKTIGVRP